MDSVLTPNPYLVQFDDIAPQNMITFGGKPPKRVKDSAEPPPERVFTLLKQLNYRVKELRRTLIAKEDLDQNVELDSEEYTTETVIGAFINLRTVLKEVVKNLSSNDIQKLRGMMAYNHKNRTLEGFVKDYFELVLLCEKKKNPNINLDFLKRMTNKIFGFTFEELGIEFQLF